MILQVSLGLLKCHNILRTRFMKELSEVNLELENEIISIIEQGNGFDDNGEYGEALKKYDEAYNKLPEPKLKWEMISAWLAGCYYNAYFGLRDFHKAKEWAVLELKCRSSDIDVAPYMDLGMASYELNSLEESFGYFEVVYNYGKERPFREYPKKYYDFFIGKINK